MRASSKDGMDDTELRRAGLMKEPESGGMDNAFIGGKHGCERRLETTWALPSFGGWDEWKSRQVVAWMILSFVVRD